MPSTARRRVLIRESRFGTMLPIQLPQGPYGVAIERSRFIIKIVRTPLRFQRGNKCTRAAVFISPIIGEISPIVGIFSPIEMRGEGILLQIHQFTL